MSPITAGAASDKINELRSKLAVYAKMAEVLQSNFMPNDAGAPEDRIERPDGGAVTGAHLQLVLEDIDMKMSELHEELSEWEGLTFRPDKPEAAKVQMLPTAETKKVVAEKGKGHGRRFQQPQAAKQS